MVFSTLSGCKLSLLSFFYKNKLQYSPTWYSLPSGEKIVICLSKPALLSRAILIRDLIRSQLGYQNYLFCLIRKILQNSEDDNSTASFDVLIFLFNLRLSFNQCVFYGYNTTDNTGEWIDGFVSVLPFKRFFSLQFLTRLMLHHYIISKKVKLQYFRTKIVCLVYGK